LGTSLEGPAGPFAVAVRGGFLVGRDVTVYDCARHGFIRGRATWFLMAALAAFTLALSAEPAVRAAGG
jgi:hypothetical protein